MQALESKNGVRVLKRVALSENSANIPGDDRTFLVELRRGLLQALTAIEKKLGISRKCRQCGHVLSTD